MPLLNIHILLKDYVLLFLLSVSDGGIIIIKTQNYMTKIFNENYNEENVRNFVIKNNPIYSVDMSSLKLFGDGINMDEINYLLQKGYKKLETANELKDLFGDEIFYIQAFLMCCKLIAEVQMLLLYFDS